MCAQIFQLVQLSCGQIFVQSGIERRLAQGANEHAEKASDGTLPERRIAILEAFHVLEQLQVLLVTDPDGLGIPMSSSTLSMLGISYLRMRLALRIDDLRLMRISLLGHAFMMLMGGFFHSATKLHAEAEKGAGQDDYMRTYLLQGRCFLALFTNIEVAVASGFEAASLAKQMKLTDRANDVSFWSSLAAFNAGRFKWCWRQVDTYFFRSQQEAVSVNARKALRVVFTDQAKYAAPSCLDSVGFSSAVQRTLGQISCACSTTLQKQQTVWSLPCLPAKASCGKSGNLGSLHP